MSQQTDRSRALRILELNRAAEKARRDHPGDEAYNRGVRDGVDNAMRLLTGAKTLAHDHPDLLEQISAAKSHAADGQYELGVHAGMENIQGQLKAASKPRAGAWSPGGSGRSPVENDRSSRRRRG